MADVRSLLRQQRAARRIEHPHASYSDAGKLTCNVCHELVKTEALWDNHLRSAGHRQRLQSLHQASTKNGTKGYAGFVDQEPDRNGQPGQSNKRKLGDSEEDEPAGRDDGVGPRKRTKADIAPQDQTPVKKDDGTRTGKPETPPLARRTSGTPTIGVELDIPSRPATPSSAGTPMSATPKAAPIGRSPLIPDESSGLGQPKTTPAPPTAETQPSSATAAQAAPAPVDEDEWAAFEAELVHGTAGSTRAKPVGAAVAALDSDAVISAPAMSAAEVAAKSEEEERTRRRALVDIQLEDEKEEATRALETEFDVMEELEARARKLRERREQLRVQANGGAASAVAVADGEKGAAPGKENVSMEEDEDDDEEDELDDWDGFRFRA
ncbi:c9b8b45e-e1d7-4d97-a532-76d9bc36171c [Thermothielavioides terrestris]|uniref:Uncharacterized protein n=2 Tax=Thermothielavioides terrestris TaxID=2587410 RepID=G2QWA9_THETT|nr:uncharacterized protein THITE_2109481 [Thermothielavioides terrestris NRRL 8126]AEO63884.1 hypothetical protein THITE_2109481 [Thermothielavioides terrestris NRRL 8126]SPQ23389.1 c9b8b45e-e1d7-4d97-a532-76d9bc36171c [Thermothielavioides terrestris]